MRSIKFNLSKKPVNAWDGAALLVEAYFASKLKADQVLELLPDSVIGRKRARCQSLFLGALRHGHRSRAAFRPLFRKSPKPLVEAILLVAGYEIFTEDPERHPKIVHHAVERSKTLVNRFEQSFLNAILRKLPTAIGAIEESTDPAHFHSHPQWLVDHWFGTFGSARTFDLLRWNQQIPDQYLRIYEPVEVLPEFLIETAWKGFYKISKSVDWQNELKPLLNKGFAYVKDPSTRIAPALLAPKPGMTVLDLCAAPGGKSYDLADSMKFSGQLVSVDLPGNRISRLKDNLSLLSDRSLKTCIVECDVLDLEAANLREQKLPELYDAVMLDVPCSNTGVIQRRTDVKWRLGARDIHNCANLQKQLLAAGSRFVQPGGCLVYSTCSIEKEENREVIDAFLASSQGEHFREESSTTSLPWESGHDGAGAVLLRCTPTLKQH